MGFQYIPKDKLSALPKSPGIYAFKGNPSASSGRGGLLYMGKAANIRERVKNHFQQLRLRPFDFAQGFGGQASFRDTLFMYKVERIGFMETNSEIEALLLESQLIKKFQPKYNVIWKDDKKYFYVAVTKDLLPRVFLTHQPQRVSSMKYEVYGRRGQKNTKYKILDTKYIGPFTDGKAIKKTLRMLRRVFPYYTLRRFRSSGQAAHPRLPCSYCHLGLCPGPAPDAKEYKRNIDRLIRILQGQNKLVARSIKKDMENAAKSEHYEKAGKIRDQLFSLENVMAHTVFTFPSEKQEGVPWKDIQTELAVIAGTSKNLSRIEAYDISNIQGKEATGSLVVFRDGKPAKSEYRKFRIRSAGKSNDVAMLKETLTRRFSHKEWKFPDFILIDGGKPQLSAALQVLRVNVKNPKLRSPASQLEAGLLKIKVAALAKKKNELFLEGKQTPLLLKDMPSQVSHLFLRMRDEAHRFAIFYHRKLLSKALLDPVHKRR